MEDEIEDILLARQEHIMYQIKDGSIRFKKGIKEAHMGFRENLIPWLMDSELKNLVSALHSVLWPFHLRAWIKTG